MASSSEGLGVSWQDSASATIFCFPGLYKISKS